MTGFVYVALGGGIGAALRYGCGLVAARHVGEPGLWATLFVNGAGSFAMGLFMGWWTARDGSSGEALQLLVAVGLLGGFTTYSAYALETVRLIERGQISAAASYAVGTMALCLVAFMLGTALGLRVPG